MEASLTAAARIAATNRRSIRIKIALAVLKYAALFLMMTALSRLTVFGVRPLGAAFCLAVLFLRCPQFIILPLFVLAECIAGWSVAAAIPAICQCAVFAAGQILYNRLKKRRAWIHPIAAVLAGTTVFILGGTLPHFLASAFLCAAFYYCVREAARPVLVEKLRYRMLETEVICLCAVFAAVAAGFASSDFFGMETALLVSVLAILAAAKLSGANPALMTAAVTGAGVAVSRFDPAAALPLIAIGMAAAAFCSAPKAVAPITAVAAFVICRFFFHAELTAIASESIAVSAAGIIYLCVPSFVYQRIASRFFKSKMPDTVRYLINVSRSITGAKLAGAAGVFRSMSDALCKVDSPLPELSGSLKNRVCASCDNLAVCGGLRHDQALDEMLRTAVQKGRVLVGDIPEILSDRCTHLAKLVSAAAALSESRKQELTQIENDRAAKRVIAEQMRGMSEVLSDLSQDAVKPVSTDPEQERKLVTECNYRGLAVPDALITAEDIALVIRIESYDRAAVERAVSAVMKKKYAVCKLDDTVLAGFCFVGLKVRPRYDMIFSASSAAKNQDGKSGDTHSFIKIAPDRFMMALCDGMGSGSAAAVASERAIGLVESFYRAGFSGELVLRLVNRFLARCGGERFSALDICVVDLSTATADIIKMGAPASFIKRKDTVERIDGAALPIGVMETALPTVVRVSLGVGDAVVLCSDGISDSFEDDRLTAAVNSLQTKNPTVLTQGLLEKALFATAGTPIDDATVVAAKLIEI